MHFVISGESPRHVLQCDQDGKQIDNIVVVCSGNTQTEDPNAQGRSSSNIYHCKQIQALSSSFEINGWFTRPKGTCACCQRTDRFTGMPLRFLIETGMFEKDKRMVHKYVLGAYFTH